MGATRFLLFLALAACSASTLAQVMPVPGTRSYLGLNLGRGLDSCPNTSLVCERERPANLYAGTMFGKYWGAEVGYVDTGRLWRGGNETRATGLNLSLVGRARIAPSFGVFGKVGTTYGRADTSVLGNGPATGPEPGFGLSFGGGVSYDITPQLSATFEWDSHDLRFSTGRDPVRSTNLGLQLRY
jgi:OOP family OmpA-OmpF porin